MANKEKSFGCRYIAKHSKEGSKPFETRDVEDHFLSFEDWDYCYVDYLCDDSIRYDLVEVIGHPVMIGDVIDYTGEKKIDIVWSDSSCAIDIRDWENSLNLFNLWDNKRTPIEEQSDGCVNYVYSLIQKD